MFTPGSRACAYNIASGRGKWPNRDPIDELGFNLLIRSQKAMGAVEVKNRYGFVHNDPLDRSDILGLVERLEIETVRALQQFWNQGAAECVLDNISREQLEKAARNAEEAAKRYAADPKKWDPKWVQFQNDRAHRLRDFLKRRPPLGPICPKLRCIPGVLLIIPGILDDLDRWLRATENNVTFEKQLELDFQNAGELIMTPFGPIPNPYYRITI